MRIAYICQSLDKKGGQERILIEKASALASMGHDVCMIVNNTPGCAPAYPLDGRVKFVDISLPIPRGILPRLLFKIRQDLRIWRALRRFRPDIRVAVPTWLALPILYGPGKLVLESHASRNMMFHAESRKAYKEWKVRRGERLADTVVSLTQEDAAGWLRAKRVEVIGNFSDIKSEYSGERQGGLAVGRLHPHKDFALLVDAWRCVADRYPQATLDIYGEGELRGELEERISCLGLDGKVVLRGNSDDMAEVYSRHEFLVMSSVAEGMPLVLIEAMQCGCPCVCLDFSSGPREIIRDGVDGVLVKSRSMSREEKVEALGDAICSMLESPGASREMGERARENASRFEKGKIMLRWEKFFGELV